MATIPLYQVDAFSERPFGGNPAAVCPLDAAIPEALMQEIAAETNLSETAFFHPQGDAFSLRWFTPTVEVDLCGHATLASAFVFFTQLHPLRDEVSFRTRSGLLSVRRGEDGSMTMNFPALPPAPVDRDTHATVERAVGIKASEVLRSGNGTLLAVLADEDAVRNVTPDFAAVARTGTSICVTAVASPQQRRPIDFVSRYFAPAYGIPEDPVTGSSFCILAPYWAARLGKRALQARQLSRRGGEVACVWEGDRVLISGKAALVITGALHY